jgi:hypothetical protein
LSYDDEARPFVVLSSAHAGRWSVLLEPWGTEFVLGQDDKLRIYSHSFSNSEVEFAYIATGIVLYFSGNSEPRVFDQDGEELGI